MNAILELSPSHLYSFEVLRAFPSSARPPPRKHTRNSRPELRDLIHISSPHTHIPHQFQTTGTVVRKRVVITVRLGALGCAPGELDELARLSSGRVEDKDISDMLEGLQAVS